MDRGRTPITTLEGCEEFISDFLSKRKLKLTDKRQLTHIEKHDKKLAEKVASDRTLRRFRVDDVSKDLSSLCDAGYVNQLHYYRGDGSVFESIDNRGYFALDFSRNTRLNRTDFTRHLMQLGEAEPAERVSKWVDHTCDFTHSGAKLRRSRSAPSIALNTTPPYNRFTKGYDQWVKEYFELHNVDPDLNLPHDLAFYYQEFSKSLSLTLSNICETIDPNTIKPGWQPIDSILFSTFDQHFYITVPPSPDMIADISTKIDKYLRTLQPLPQQSREHWKFCNVVLSSSGVAKFRRARHICTRGELDWFVEIDTGKVVTLHKSSSKYVIKMPPQFASIPTIIMECRFRDMSMSEEEVTREIGNLRQQGKILISGFDHTTRRPSYLIILKEKSDDALRNSKRSTIKTAIVEIVKEKPKEHTPMTSVFCGELECTGCYSLRTFRKSVVAKPSSSENRARAQ